MDKRHKELAEEFFGHWSIDVLIKDHNKVDRNTGEVLESLTRMEAYQILTQDEVIEHLDFMSELQEKLYSRMPRYLAAQYIMEKIKTVKSASEGGQVVSAFSKWFQDAPPPSNRKFIKDLMDNLEYDPNAS